VIGDCLWPVICVVEKLSGKAAIQRSRDLMTGLRSAGRALAIRHLALAAFAIADVIKSIGFLWQSGPIKQANVVITAPGFPCLRSMQGPDRCFCTTGRRPTKVVSPLLQLDRTPEVRITARAFSVSSMIWLASMGAIYLLYQPPIKLERRAGRTRKGFMVDSQEARSSDAWKFLGCTSALAIGWNSVNALRCSSAADA
jgi:hypothetical protein